MSSPLNQTDTILSTSMQVKLLSQLLHINLMFLHDAGVSVQQMKKLKYVVGNLYILILRFPLQVFIPHDQGRPVLIDLLFHTNTSWVRLLILLPLCLLHYWSRYKDELQLFPWPASEFGVSLVPTFLNLAKDNDQFSSSKWDSSAAQQVACTDLSFTKTLQLLVENATAWIFLQSMNGNIIDRPWHSGNYKNLQIWAVRPEYLVAIDWVMENSIEQMFDLSISYLMDDACVAHEKCHGFLPVALLTTFLIGLFFVWQVTQYILSLISYEIGTEVEGILLNKAVGFEFDDLFAQLVGIRLGNYTGSEHGCTSNNLANSEHSDDEFNKNAEVTDGRVERWCQYKLNDTSMEDPCIWMMICFQESEAPWDPGDFKSGLRASRILSGGECHGLGYWASIWASVGELYGPGTGYGYMNRNGRRKEASNKNLNF